MRRRAARRRPAPRPPGRSRCPPPSLAALPREPRVKLPNAVAPFATAGTFDPVRIAAPSISATRPTLAADVPSAPRGGTAFEPSRIAGAGSTLSNRLRDDSDLRHGGASGLRLWGRGPPGPVHRPVVSGQNWALNPLPCRSACLSPERVLYATQRAPGLFPRRYDGGPYPMLATNTMGDTGRTGAKLGLAEPIAESPAYTGRSHLGATDTAFVRSLTPPRGFLVSRWLSHGRSVLEDSYHLGRCQVWKLCVPASLHRPLFGEVSNHGQSLGDRVGNVRASNQRPDRVRVRFAF